MKKRQMTPTISTSRKYFKSHVYRVRRTLGLKQAIFQSQAEFLGIIISSSLDLLELQPSKSIRKNRENLIKITKAIRFLKTSQLVEDYCFFVNLDLTKLQNEIIPRLLEKAIEINSETFKKSAIE